MYVSPSKRLKAFQSDRRGATAVEFAIIAAPLIALILSSVQLGVIFFYDQALQTVAETASRQIMTGSAQTASMTQTQFQNLICSYASSLFNCSNIMVDVESASTFSAIITTPPTITYNAQGQPTNAWSYSPGNPGDVVIVRIMYNWPVVGGPLSLNLANQSNGTYLIRATVVFKNEPYL